MRGRTADPRIVRIPDNARPTVDPTAPDFDQRKHDRDVAELVERYTPRDERDERGSKTGGR